MFVRIERIIIMFFYRHTQKKRLTVFLSLETFKNDHPVENEQ